MRGYVLNSINSASLNDFSSTSAIICGIFSMIFFMCNIPV